MKEQIVKELVNEFLAWKLPSDFSPDGGISLTRTFSPDDPFRPSGTNLFHAGQAKDMFEYLLSKSPTFANALIGDSEPIAVMHKDGFKLSYSATWKDIEKLPNGDLNLYLKPPSLIAKEDECERYRKALEKLSEGGGVIGRLAEKALKG